MKKRLFSWLLVLAMVLSMMPTVAFATGEETETSDSTTIFSDGFEDYSLGDFADYGTDKNWNRQRYNAQGATTTYKIVSETDRGNVLELHTAGSSTSGTANGTQQVSFKTTDTFAGNYTVKTDVKITHTDSGYYCSAVLLKELGANFVIQPSSSWGFYWKGAKEGNVFAMQAADSTAKLIPTYNTWYTIELIVNGGNGTANIYDEEGTLLGTTEATFTAAETTVHLEHYGAYKGAKKDLSGTTYFDNVSIACNHQWDNGVVTVEPTTEAEGEMTYTCEDCSATKTEVIEKLTHTCADHILVDAVAPTCTTAGNIAYWTCGAEECDLVYADADGVVGEMIPQADTVLAIDPDAHNMQTVAVVAPTEDAAGFTAHTECTYCGLTEGKYTTWKLTVADNVTTNVTAGAVVEGVEVVVFPADSTKAVKTVYVNGEAIDGVSFDMTKSAAVTADLVDASASESDDFESYTVDESLPYGGEDDVWAAQPRFGDNGGTVTYNIVEEEGRGKVLELKGANGTGTQQVSFVHAKTFKGNYTVRVDVKATEGADGVGYTGAIFLTNKAAKAGSELAEFDFRTSAEDFTFNNGAGGFIYQTGSTTDKVAFALDTWYTVELVVNGSIVTGNVYDEDGVLLGSQTFTGVAMDEAYLHLEHYNYKGSSYAASYFDNLSVTCHHQWNSGTVTVEPTTESEGEMTYTCDFCGGTKTEVIEKLTHTCANHIFVEAVAPTCVATGNIAYWTCGSCDLVYADDNGTVGAMITLPETVLAIDPDAHNMVEVEALAPTDETAGYTAYTDCSYCDHIEGKQTTWLIEAGDENAALSHSGAVVEGTVVTVSSMEEGYTVKSVKVNGEAITGTTFTVTESATVTADLVEWTVFEGFDGEYTDGAYDFSKIYVEKSSSTGGHVYTAETLEDGTTVLNITATADCDDNLYIGSSEGALQLKGGFVYETRVKYNSGKDGNPYTHIYSGKISSSGTATAGKSNFAMRLANFACQVWRNSTNGSSTKISNEAAYKAQYQDWATVRITVNNLEGTADDIVLVEVFAADGSFIGSCTLTAAANQLTIADAVTFAIKARTANIDLDLDYVAAACFHANTEAVEAKAPTCTEDGYEAGTVCTDCGAVVEGKEPVSALGGEHNMVAMEAKAPTAEEAGYTAYTQCDKCNLIEGKQTTYLLTVGENVIHNATEAVEGGFAVVEGTKVTLKYQAEPGYMLDTFTVNGEAIGSPWYGMVGNANITVSFKEIPAFEQGFEGELPATPTLEDVNLVKQSGEEGTYSIVDTAEGGKALQIVVADGEDTDDYARTWINTNTNYSGDFVAETRMMLGTDLAAVSAKTAGEYVSMFRMQGIYVPSTESTSTWKDSPWAPASNLELKYFAEGDNTGYIALNVTGEHTEANKLEGETHAAWFMKDGEKLVINKGEWYTYRATVISSEGTALVEILDASGNLLASRELEGVYALKNAPVGIDMFAAGTYQIDYLNVTAYAAEEEPEEPVITGTLSDNQRTLNLSDRVYINYFVGYEGFEGMTTEEMETAGGLLVWDYEVTEETAVFENRQNVVEGMTYDSKYNEFKTVSTGIVSTDYSKVLYLRPYVKVGEDQYIYGVLKPYSVREYCEGRLAKSNDAALKKLCANLLHYGAAAQTNWTVSIDDLANKNVDLTQWPNTVGQLDRTTWQPSISEFTYNFELSDLAADTGKTLDLADQIKVKNYYKYDGGKSTPASAELLVWEGTTDLTLDNVSYTLPMVKEGSEYLAIGNGLASNQYGKAVFSCAKFVDAEGAAHYSIIQCYTPEVYARKMFDKNSNTKLMNLMEAMVLFGEAAVAKFGQG